MSANALSFKDMYDNVLAFLQTTSSDTTSLAIVKEEINRVYERITTEYDWDELWDHKGLDDAFTVNLGIAYLQLPTDCQHVKEIYNTSKDVSYLPQSVRHIIRDNVATLATNAKIDSYFTMQGRQPIKGPLPASGDTIDVRSDAAGDTSKDVRVVGLRQTGEIREIETIATDASNGTTWTSGSVTWRQGWSLDSISIDAVHTGTIEVRDSTANTTLAQIPPHEKQALYTMVRFENPPDAADSVIIYYKKRVHELTDDADAVIIPDLAQVIIEEVKGSMRQYNKKYQQGGVHISQANRALRAVLKDRRMNAPMNRQARPNYVGRGLRRAY